MDLVRSCSDLRKPTPEETKNFVESLDSSINELWYCGWCNSGQNEWLLIQMLYDPVNEFMVTPCCHTEASEALVNYALAKDDWDQKAGDEKEIMAVTR